MLSPAKNDADDVLGIVADEKLLRLLPLDDADPLLPKLPSRRFFRMGPPPPRGAPAMPRPGAVEVADVDDVVDPGAMTMLPLLGLHSGGIESTPVVVVVVVLMRLPSIDDSSGNGKG